MTGQVEVRFEPSGRSARVTSGTTLLDAARLAGEPIDAPCDGSGLCGACKVHATGVLSAVTRDEEDLLGRTHAAEGLRLACRARALGNVVVWHAVSSTDMRVSFDSVTESQAESIDRNGGVNGQEDHDTGRYDSRQPLGAAVDVGTTTIALAVVDLETGIEVARAGALNAQSAFGADVMSRVARAVAGGQDEMRKTAIAQIEQMLLQALKRASAAPGRLTEIVCVGNTAMTGLLLGRDLTPLADAPYEGASVDAGDLTGADLGMTVFAGTRVRVLPGVSAFIGADIVAGLLAAGIAGRSRPVLFIDAGTNGEIVLVTEDSILATATAAGPALEGAELSDGMRAEDGAIERVAFTGDDLLFDVIGGGTPRGICGSGVVDLVRVLLSEGVLDETGLLHDDAASPLSGRSSQRDGLRAFMLDPRVWFTQLDVRQVQLALAAVRTGVDALLAEADVDPSDVTETVLAGGFGAHLDNASVMRAGMLPGAIGGGVTFAGNTALAGARKALLDPDVFYRAAELVSQIQSINLAVRPDFQERYLTTLANIFELGFDIRHI